MLGKKFYLHLELAPVKDITRISCFVATRRLLHALQLYSTVFVKKCAFAFFKVVQQQTIGEVGVFVGR